MPAVKPATASTPMEVRLGYARVSTRTQEIQSQVDVLEASGAATLRPACELRTPEPCTSGLVFEPEPQLLARVRSRRGSRRSQWRCSAEGLKASVSDIVKPWIVPG